MQAAHRWLVAVDVDGTLLNTELEDVLRSRELEALEAVRAAGHLLVLCTGRNLRSVRGLLERSAWDPADLPLILLNGASIWGGTPRRLLHNRELATDDIARAIAIFRRHGIVPMVYGSDSDGGVLHHEDLPVNHVLGRYLQARRHTVGALEVVPDLLAISFARALEVGSIDHREPIMALTTDLERELDGRVRVINTRSLLGGGEYFWAEVFCVGSDKGTAVSYLADVHGMPRSSILALGDNYNDLDMFRVAGLSVAMGNSPDDVKSEADLIAGDVADGGAAVVLERVAAGELTPIAGRGSGT